MTRSVVIDMDDERLHTSARMLIFYNLKEEPHAA